MKKNPPYGFDLTRKEIEKLIREINNRLAEIDKSASPDTNSELSLDEQMEIYKRNNLKLTSKEVATMLGCSKRKVRALKARGELPSFGYNDVVNYINNRKE